DNVPERYRATAVSLGLRNSPTGAPAVSDQPSAASVTAQTVIRFEPGRHIVVDAPINGCATDRLSLVNSASRPVISPPAPAAAGPSVARDGRVARSRGIAKDAEVEVLRVPIDSLEVGGARVGRMVVASYEMDMRDVEGLLGQDFLGNFNVAIDSSAGV